MHFVNNFTLQKTVMKLQSSMKLKSLACLVHMRKQMRQSIKRNISSLLTKSTVYGLATLTAVSANTFDAYISTYPPIFQIGQFEYP